MKKQHIVTKLFKLLFSRLALVVVLLVIQAAVLLILVLTLSKYFIYVYALFTILSLLMVIFLVNKDDNPEVRISWIICIMSFPVFGGLFYILLGRAKVDKSHKKQMMVLKNRSKDILPDDKQVFDNLAQIDKLASTQSAYIKSASTYPLYENTKTKYLKLGEVKFEQLKIELNAAKHYIFLQYFIIQEGVMWDAILDILVKKVKEGLDVRVMYDDLGCVQTLPFQYNKKLESLGIKCVVFNPFRPHFNAVLQNRDHRKIAVIDGFVGFTGGINLADEYINVYEKHGHWKDCAVMLKGEAVWSMTLMFLEAWNFYHKDDDDFAKFMPHKFHEEQFCDDGFVQPYCDSPLDSEYTGELIYMNILNEAKDYVYINTPYFIVDDALVTAFTSTAKRGVNIKMVTPHHADKWYVHLMTRSSYKKLIEAGVEIYEYTPGFIHSKTFVSDDKISTIGTINLDYRSLYHHYECGVWMYQTDATMELKKDFLEMLNVCQQVTIEDCKKEKWYKKLFITIIKIFTPLM
ncbi:MAG: cardiolipin synthase [Oscillospiraceae bacterium]